MKTWLIKKKKDFYFRQSKAQGYRSRSAYKLIEMNNKFKFLKKNILLLDLGSSPGGWSQVAAQKASNSKILSTDIKSMEKIKGIDFINGDFINKETQDKIMLFFNYKKVDVVLSDMAANTSGNKYMDSYKTGELCLNAMNLAQNILSKDGVFLSKIFMGSIFDEINKTAKRCFKNVIKYKPKSSKSESKELYIYCKGNLKI